MMDEKPHRRRFRFGLISLFVLVVAVGILAKLWNPFRPKRENLHLVKPGMTVAEVAALVGSPDKAHSHNDAATGRIGVLITHVFQVNPNEAWLVQFIDGQVVGSDHFPRD
jgi:hypothetical protein